MQCEESINGSGEGDEYEGATDHDSPMFAFIPAIAILAVILIASNVILLVLLARSWRFCTSLNIFLFSLGCLNVLTVFNQVALMVAIVNKSWVLGKGGCHLVAMIQTMFIYGVAMVHLLISRDRYFISRNPLSWKGNRKKAWICTLVLWCGISLAATFDHLLHLKDFSNVKIECNYIACYWPVIDLKCSNAPYRLALQVVTFAAFLIVSGLIYYMYIKTNKELRGNEKTKEQELRKTTSLTRNKCQKTTSERAASSLILMFTIHLITQLPTYFYNLIRHVVALGTTVELLPQACLLVLTCFSFCTTVSPLLVMLINNRYRQHVKEIICCVCDPQDDKRNLMRQLAISDRLPPRLQSKTKAHPKDISVFFGTKRASSYRKSTTTTPTTEQEWNTPDGPQEISTDTGDYDLSNGLVLFQRREIPI